MTALLHAIFRWKNLFLALSIVPMFFIGTIYIIYGSLFNGLLEVTSFPIEFLSLSNQLRYFSMLSEVPTIVIKIGQLSLFYLMGVLIFLLSANLFYTYMKLYQRRANIAVLLFECSLLALLFLFSVTPSHPIVFGLGCLLVVLNLLLLLIYGLYNRKIAK